MTFFGGATHIVFYFIFTHLIGRSDEKQSASPAKNHSSKGHFLSLAPYKANFRARVGDFATNIRTSSCIFGLQVSHHARHV